MGPIDQINHLLNFLAPALAVGFVLAVCGPFILGKKLAGSALLLQTGINFVIGALALVVGLWFFGRDGKMASYAAMLVCCALSEGLLQRR